MAVGRENHSDGIGLFGPLCYSCAISCTRVGPCPCCQELKRSESPSYLIQAAGTRKPPRKTPNIPQQERRTE